MFWCGGRRKYDKFLVIDKLLNYPELAVCYRCTYLWNLQFIANIIHRSKVLWHNAAHLFYFSIFLFRR